MTTYLNPEGVVVECRTTPYQSGIVAEDYITEAHEHKHKCRHCGTVWKHGNENANNAAAHTCPRCERLLDSPWPKFFTDAELAGQEFYLHLVSKPLDSHYRRLFQELANDYLGIYQF